MGNVWTIARQTVAEGLRMKIAVFLLLVLGALLLGLPFASKGDNSVSGAVQSFLAYSISAVTFLLSFLTIFLSKSISDDLGGKQIYMLMTKPLGRWQYLLGKWLGIVMLNVGILAIAGVSVYALTLYVAARPPLDEWDKERLEKQILTARHSAPFVVPDFTAAAAARLEEYVNEGRYAAVPDIDLDREKKRLRSEEEKRWRAVYPGEGRVFTFEDLRCPRTPDQQIQVKYDALVLHYPPDEILRCVWRFGNRAQGTAEYEIPRRDVVSRRHTVPVPADAIAPDNTLTAQFINVNPFTDMGEEQYMNTVSFQGDRAVEALFTVSSFGSNLVRALTLVACRLAFLAAVGVAAAALFSFPVAVLVALTIYVLAATHGFVSEALGYFGEEGAAGVFTGTMQSVMQAIYLIIPDFSKVDALPLLVDGRNVTLKWVLFLGLGRLLLLQTGGVLLLAGLIFQRREVAEVSV